MSTQIPGTPIGIGRGDRADISPVSGSSVTSQSAAVGNGSGAATLLSLSTTARLVGSFAVRQAGISSQSNLLRTQSVLTAAHASLQSEARIYSRSA
jgi:hypothetical protein